MPTRLAYSPLRHHRRPSPAGRSCRSRRGSGRAAAPGAPAAGRTARAAPGSPSRTRRNPRPARQSRPWRHGPASARRRSCSSAIGVGAVRRAIAPQFQMPRPFSSARSPENSSSSSTSLRTVDALQYRQQPRADPRAQHHADDRGHRDDGEHRALVEVDPRGRRVDQRQDEARRARGDLERRAHHEVQHRHVRPARARGRTSRRGRRCSVNSTSPCGVRWTCQADVATAGRVVEHAVDPQRRRQRVGCRDVGQLGLLRQRHQRDDRRGS